MRYLTSKDYLHLIRQEVLDVVIDDEALRVDAEESSEYEIKSYLASRYDVDRVFIKHDTWDKAKTYTFNTLVVLDANAFDALLIYNNDDLILFEGSIYEANATTVAGENPTTTPAKWDLLGLQYEFYTALNTGYYDSETSYTTGAKVSYNGVRYEALKDALAITPTNTEYWVINTDTIAATTDITDVSWTQGDSRYRLIIRYMIDLTLYELHSRINPRNIPEFRIQRRDDAIKYLKMVADPRHNICPDFPEKDFGENKDTVLVYGYNKKINHGQNIY